MLSCLSLHGARLSAEISRVITGSTEEEGLTLLSTRQGHAVPVCAVFAY